MSPCVAPLSSELHTPLWLRAALPGPSRSALPCCTLEITALLKLHSQAEQACLAAAAAQADGAALAHLMEKLLHRVPTERMQVALHLLNLNPERLASTCLH